LAEAEAEAEALEQALVVVEALEDMFIITHYFFLLKHLQLLLVLEAQILLLEIHQE
jgi:hypothetical protein